MGPQGWVQGSGLQSGKQYTRQVAVRNVRFSSKIVFKLMNDDSSTDDGIDAVEEGGIVDLDVERGDAVGVGVDIAEVPDVTGRTGWTAVVDLE